MNAWICYELSFLCLYYYHSWQSIERHEAMRPTEVVIKQLASQKARAWMNETHGITLQAIRSVRFKQ